MKVTVIGTGYVGLVTGACLSDLGNHVVCCDTDEGKIGLLNAGSIPIAEPGLPELVDRNRHDRRLEFTSDSAYAIAHGDILIIAVGTPADEGGAADLKDVLAATRTIGQAMTGFKVVVEKSTVPVGTGDQLALLLSEEIGKRGIVGANFSVVSNPEFLKEGSAVQDFMRPDRIVIGLSNDANGMRAQKMMRQLYAPFNRNHERTYFMNLRSAEFTKYAANAMLATRISFMNELANLADKIGVDIEMVRQGIGSDSRIGFGFLYAGAGYGGSCLPKDVQALTRTAKENGQLLRILSSVENINDDQKHVLAEKIRRRFGDNLKGFRFAFWGLAFKPNTDDMRAAPSRALISDLVLAGANVAAYDPAALNQARDAIERDLSHIPGGGSSVDFVNSPGLALEGADALIIMTDWKAFKSPDFAQIKNTLKYPVIFDGRNLYEPSDMEIMGIEYYGIGRSTARFPASD